jgi:hypothetical protein
MENKVIELSKAIDEIFKIESGDMSILMLTVLKYIGIHERSTK